MVSKFLKTSAVALALVALLALPVSANAKGKGKLKTYKQTVSVVFNQTSTVACSADMQTFTGTLFTYRHNDKLRNFKLKNNASVASSNDYKNKTTYVNICELANTVITSKTGEECRLDENNQNVCTGGTEVSAMSVETWGSATLRYKYKAKKRLSEKKLVITKKAYSVLIDVN
jgi:hypothetical protein